MSRPLLLGESPSKVGDRYYHFPLSGRPAERLLRFAGIERERESDQRVSRLGLKGREKLVAAYWTLTEHFDTLNVLERWPGERWPEQAAHDRWARYVEEEGWLKVLVCVGARAAKAVYLGHRDWFEWDTYGETWGVKIPHPSGLNHLYNDEANRERAGEVLREAIERAR